MSEEIRIRPAGSRADYDACVELQRAVWGLHDLEITSAIQLIATVHAGGIVHLAEGADGRAVGFCYAFPAIKGGVPHLHSDMLAVLPNRQAQGIGARLKWAQRDEALARGLSFVTWTFDPLQARNANLNLRRLGAVAPEFVPDMYGITTSSLHHGLPTDRLVVRWELDSERVRERAAAGELPRSVATPDGEPVNEVVWKAGWPVSSEPSTELEAESLLLEIPPDWDVLSSAAPRVASDWQRKVRVALSAYLGRGYVAADFAPTEAGGRRRPFYVLRRR
ncbi:MAG: GNAT family N-acetyltransferase [Vicinamibacteria bacterium]|nr:GNAT family N-acetyltransferase [Vicinamibacteria bacterium]